MKIQLKKLEKRNHSQKIYYRHPQQLSAQSEIYVFLLISQPYFASTFFFFFVETHHISQLALAVMARLHLAVF